MNERALRLRIARVSYIVPMVFLSLIGLGHVERVSGDEASAVQPAQNVLASESKKVDPVTVVTDLRYGSQPGRSGLCDVYQPRSDDAVAHPVVVAVHGGGWAGGDKWMLGRYARQLAAKGFVVVAINYRHAPKYKFPAQVDDVRQSLLWVVQHAEQFAIDADRLGLFGYSAGGHLSALVGSLSDEPIDVQAQSSQWLPSDSRWQRLPKVQAVCAGGPPCDFRNLPIDNTAMSYFLGGSPRDVPEVYRAASPVAFVTPGDPVTQLIHGESDLIVPIENSRRFYDAQKAVGVESRLTVMPKQGHLVTFMNPKTVQHVVDFFQRTLKPLEADPASSAP